MSSILLKFFTARAYWLTEKEVKDMIYRRFLSKRCDPAAANAIASNATPILARYH
jgi:hypothetical protein